MNTRGAAKKYSSKKRRVSFGDNENLPSPAEVQLKPL